MFLTCLGIYAARIVDVSLGTLRTVFFVKGKTIQPFVIAFFEVLIWYLVARQALNADGSPYLIAVSYALGYATGTYIGTKLSNRFVKGIVGVQVIISKKIDKLLEKLRNNDYSVSIIPLEKSYDKKSKYMLYIQVNNNMLKKLENLIKKYDENAFIVVNETKYVRNGFVK